jgi:hypothetical protein
MKPNTIVDLYKKLKTLDEIKSQSIKYTISNMKSKDIGVIGSILLCFETKNGSKLNAPLANVDFIGLDGNSQLYKSTVKKIQNKRLTEDESNKEAFIDLFNDSKIKSFIPTTYNDIEIDIITQSLLQKISIQTKDSKSEHSVHMQKSIGYIYQNSCEIQRFISKDSAVLFDEKQGIVSEKSQIGDLKFTNSPIEALIFTDISELNKFKTTNLESVALKNITSYEKDNIASILKYSGDNKDIDYTSLNTKELLNHLNNNNEPIYGQTYSLIGDTFIAQKNQVEKININNSLKNK